MLKNRPLLIIISLITLSIFCLLVRRVTVLTHTDNGNDDLVRINLAGQKIVAEVAETPKQRQGGLMLRESLGWDEGMLFVFENEDPRAFWMKNTLIPLDMVWINSSFKVVNITHNAQPCEKLPCALYNSSVKAKYVLELNGGWADENNLTIGDKIEILE